MNLTHIFSDVLSSALPPVIWLTHPSALTRPVVRRLLPVYRPGSWFVFRPCNIVCFYTVHVLYAHRAMFPVQKKVNTRQQFTNIRKGFEQRAPFWTGREQTEDKRATWWTKKTGESMLHWRPIQENSWFDSHSQRTCMHHQHELQQHCCT